MGNGQTKEKTKLAKVGETTIYSAPQLLSLNLKTPDWLIDGILPPGLTLLSAHPKVGKSFFCLQMLLCVTSKKIFPGSSMAPKKTKAIYLSLEDPLFVVRDRLQWLCEALDIKEPPENLLIPDQRGFEDERKAGTFLRNLLDFHKPDFLVIDTLAAFLPGLPKLSDYLGWLQKILLIRNVLAERGCSCVLVHHARKTNAKEAFDPLQAAHGSIGLTAGVDNVALLTKRGDVHSLYLQGKQVLSTAIGLVFVDGLFQLVDNPVVAQLEGRARQVYKKLFEEKEGPGRTPKEITWMLKLPDTKRSSVHDALKKLVEKGIVRKYERGYYKLEEGYRQNERPLPTELGKIGRTAP